MSDIRKIYESLRNVKLPKEFRLEYNSRHDVMRLNGDDPYGEWESLTLLCLASTSKRAYKLIVDADWDDIPDEYRKDFDNFLRQVVDSMKDYDSYYQKYSTEVIMSYADTNEVPSYKEGSE